MSPPSFDWPGFLISLYCRVDFSHNISPNLLSFQTRLTQWQRVCRPVQFDSVWFFHQPCNITTKVQLMKKHLTSTYFHQQFEHIFIFWNPVVCRFPYFISAKLWKKRFHTSTFQPKVLTLSWERANKQLLLCGHIMACLVSLYL